MCQPHCQFRPWECTAIRRGLITVPGIIIAMYGIVLVIYVSRHIYTNFLAALVGLVGSGPAKHEDYAGGLCLTATVSYLLLFPYPGPCVALPDLIRAMVTPSLLLLDAHCPQWLSSMASSLPAAPIREVLMPLHAGGIELVKQASAHSR
jgi:hypothetical protein